MAVAWTKREMTFSGVPSFSEDKIGKVPPYTKVRTLKARGSMLMLKRRLEEEKGVEYSVVRLDGVERCVRTKDLMTEEEFNARRICLQKERILR